MLIVVAVLAISAYGLMSPLLGIFLPSYALTRDQQGNLALVNALGLIVASVFSGPLIDAKGNRLAMAGGLTVMTLSLLWLSRAAAYPEWIAVYFSLGLSGGIVMTCANALVSNVASTNRAAALNFLNLFFGLGGILSTSIASYLLTSQALCILIATVAVLALAVNFSAPRKLGTTYQALRFDQIPALFTRPLLPLLSLLLFFYVACEVGVWNWFKSYLISIQINPRTAGGIISYGFALGMLVGRLIASGLLITLQPLPVLVVSSILIAIATSATLYVSSAVAVTLAVFAAGMSMAPVFPTTLAIVANHFPQATATALCITIASGWLGLAVSSPLIGALAAHSSLRQALLFLPGLAMAMVLVNLVLVRALRARNVP